MNILGFSFSKIAIEKLNGKADKIKIDSNINILEIKPADSGMLKTKDELLEVKFTHLIKYEPEYAKIEFSGNIFLSAEPKLSKEIMKEWKSKKLKEDFRVFVFNIILKKSNIKALELEDEMNLPPHIPLPEVRPNTEQKQESKSE